ncbi:sterile alpha motif domain-containing protein 1-like [Myiozetetes cayanensis]|uniref:sterile alpha motif domain-containing protein 1-like n=1 Tax=Myiozetetes cayanensis TaxID=478635 RepID=UPI0021607178|nr:sterile alpha motif domain-containing protein 1-like [Myiozetetes cayanensis]
MRRGRPAAAPPGHPDPERLLPDTPTPSGSSRTPRPRVAPPAPQRRPQPPLRLPPRVSSAPAPAPAPPEPSRALPRPAPQGQPRPAGPAHRAPPGSARAPPAGGAGAAAAAPQRNMASGGSAMELGKERGVTYSWPGLGRGSADGAVKRGPPRALLRLPPRPARRRSVPSPLCPHPRPHRLTALPLRSPAPLPLTGMRLRSAPPTALSGASVVSPPTPAVSDAPGARRGGRSLGWPEPAAPGAAGFSGMPAGHRSLRRAPAAGPLLPAPGHRAPP